MNYQKLFDYFHEQHGISLLLTDMQEVARIVKEMEEPGSTDSTCPIIDVCGFTIDLRKVERVTPVGGDKNHLSYMVYFTGGNKIEIPHAQQFANGKKFDHMEREKFVELWKSFNLSIHA
jgi:hypothetical protein